MNARYLTMLTTLAFIGFSVSALAHDCSRHGDDNTHKHCSPKGNPNADSNDKNFPVKVIFRDGPLDTIQSEADGIFPFPYIDGVNVTATVPEEGSPPGQFLMWQGSGKHVSSTLFFYFGDAVKCDSGDSLEECVVDSDGVTVLCPFLPNDRYPIGQCAGFKPTTLTFRHTVDGEGDPVDFMLGMPNSPPNDPLVFDGESGDVEFQFPAEKNVGGWQLIFDPRCLGRTGTDAGEYLRIEAFDNFDDDLDNDEWHIGTGVDVKRACLAKTGKGQVVNFIGLFDMKFNYTICVLADPDSGDGNCLGD